MSRFLPDDYEELNRKFFGSIRSAGKYAADPSGWTHTVLDAEHWLPDELRHINGTKQYFIDEDKELLFFKEPFIEFASQWDDTSYSLDNITLCNSVTVGMATVLSTLKRQGIKTVFFETPVYFAAVCQAKTFGLKVKLVPSYLNDSFIPISYAPSLRGDQHPVAVWVSQPLSYIGTNQEADRLRRILRSLPRGSYMIIDEATEQLWPSVLRSLTIRHKNIIKIRSLTKGIGLNGLRMAYIIHNASLRPEIVSSLENFQGGMDVQSITVSKFLVENAPLFSHMLMSARQQVQSLKRRADAEVLGTPMILTDIQNGYLGSVALRRPTSLKRRTSWRMKIIEHCVRSDCPVILGSTMYFAVDPNLEFIRLTYFSEGSHIINGLRILSAVYADSADQAGSP
ncbi:MAG: aminotransferase class I/II-fold pyridoxal phosphate-dependent enzyme [Thaumarchaeota archaeon]|nr:aminotransferase class I/II-fold pyridoxal phosphate-dependent enzyme [Nitrososphaerota archaeon]